MTGLQRAGAAIVGAAPEAAHGAPSAGGKTG